MLCTSDVFLLAQKVILRLCRSDIRTSCEFWGIELLINNCGRHSLIRTHTHSMPTYTRNLPIQGVLINGMCLFGVGGARRRPYRASSLTISTSDCDVLLRSSHTKRSGIMREMSLLCEHRKERSDGIAIATKSIASCCPPLRGRRGFPLAKRRGGTAIGKTP